MVVGVHVEPPQQVFLEWRERPRRHGLDVAERQERQHLQSLFARHQIGEGHDGVWIAEVAAEGDLRHLEMMPDEEGHGLAVVGREPEAREHDLGEAGALGGVFLVLPLADVVIEQGQREQFGRWISVRSSRARPAALDGRQSDSRCGSRGACARRRCTCVKSRTTRERMPSTRKHHREQPHSSISDSARERPGTGRSSASSRARSARAPRSSRRYIDPRDPDHRERLFENRTVVRDATGRLDPRARAATRRAPNRRSEHHRRQSRSGSPADRRHCRAIDDAPGPGQRSRHRARRTKVITITIHPLAGARARMPRARPRAPAGRARAVHVAPGLEVQHRAGAQHELLRVVEPLARRTRQRRTPRDAAIAGAGWLPHHERARGVLEIGFELIERVAERRVAPAPAAATRTPGPLPFAPPECARARTSSNSRRHR